ncbi:acyl-CoA synthetase (AMP-forming)/AMP-acid ligase II [Saccharopolyspora erythraea NRRL 2338]|uniref:AMP-dependent synthetase and ligase n=2 Tax=Saccharopolyspora erythraea TaxID=1836 RepID=A4FEL9_SACEN|nr:class I adenylate-forming enzyme family protein [Saccharopolyspora erythraea]EQD83548.1 AMP-dependent synthetase [Saccharopolyspora erythraea D]PFG96219.1 acyl-CoA synthetase (AMP-forming)/AMP-acid ligase II [Saccharopolyspora erythraea NRRL 2338]QRK92746.1 acyl--CoA ligase [Saccharopolyspora erythraea]CAM02494.1 AMP-dependent synthetase and ligase [Saccharopolyspora erythraea NRRL 2338]
MTAPWVSSNGVEIRDLVPARLRRQWCDEGRCPDRDLYSSFSEHVRRHPGRPAVIDARGTLDYAGLDTRVRGIAAAFAAAGLGERDIIGIRLPNGRDMVATELAVAAIGAVALPYPAGRGTRDTLSLLGRSRAGAAVFADPADVASCGELPDLRAVFTFGRPVAGARSLGLLPADARWRPGRRDADSPARILVSSGSEAEPKMVAYSHNAMVGGRANYVRALHGGTELVRDLVLVPLASSFGSCGTSVTIAALGGTLVLVDAFDPGTALRAITEHRPTHVFGVPTMLRRLADHPPAGGEDLSSLRALVSSGAALPEATAQACRDRFGREMIAVYGSSDGVNCHTARTGLAPETGTGLPDPAVADIRITDERGEPVAAGEPGEICALGPMTPMCYVASPELDTRYRTPGGWVRTGDRGFLDGRGRLHVLGRIKQVVVRGGYNISPAEVERELGAHPAIADAVCVAVADPDLGERMCVCVTQPAGVPPVTLDEITTFLERERGLERRKLPELLLAVDEMPLGPTGKICRRTLSEMATEQRRTSGAAV